MKVLLAAATVAVTLLVGSGVQAQTAENTEKNIGVMPDSPFYFFDLLAEKVYGLLLNDLSEAEYLKEKAEERLMEARTMREKKGVLSAEVKKTLDLMEDHRRASRDIIGRLVDQNRAEERAMRTLNDLHQDPYLEEFTAAQEKERLESRRAELREQIVKARTAADTAQMADLLQELEGVRREYEQLDGLASNMITTAEITAEQIEDLLAGQTKLDFVLQRAEVGKKQAQALNDTRGVEKLDGIIAKVKTATAEAQENEIKELQRTLRDDRLDFALKSVEEKAKKDLAAEAPPPPPPQPPKEAPKKPAKVPTPPVKQKAPAPPQPVLQTIPTEVTGEPLALLGFFNGMPPAEVDLFYDVQFGGQGGTPPYHFKLGTGGGFPPTGLILDANGRLSGTPRVAQTSRFNVCVVDLVGKSDCGTMVSVVAPAPVVIEALPEPAPPPPLQSNGEITSKSCTPIAWPTGEKDVWDVRLAGTATLNVGSSVTTGYGSRVNCSNWSNCTRNVGDSENSTWTLIGELHASSPRYVKFGYNTVGFNCP